MSGRISVLLVDPMRLMRDCLAQLLRSGAADIDVHGVASLENTVAGPEGPDIILINAMPRRDSWPRWKGKWRSCGPACRCW